MSDLNSEKARNIIKNNFFMTIASATKDAEPWITPVYYAFDKNYTFYWYSGKNTKHSSLISKNNRVAIAIFNSNASEEEAGGVYITGKAFEVTEKELPLALETYFTRSLPNEPEERQKMINAPEDFLDNSVLRMYKVIPEHIYVSNEADKWNGKWIDSRSEIKLSDLA